MTTSPEHVAKAWLNHLAVERGASRNTVSNYRRDLRRYLDFLADRGIDDLADVRSAQLEDYVVALREGRASANLQRPLAASSAARALIVVRGLHKFALAEGYLADDVAASVSPPQQAQHLPDTLSVDEVSRMLEAVPVDETATPVDLRDRALLELLYATGARISELMALQLDDVADLDGILVLTGKGSKQRLVPVGTMAEKALEIYTVRGRPALARGTSHALFLNRRGGALSRQTAWSVIKKAVERAGIEKRVSPHTLRHSFATHLLQGGADVRVVQELLGHASVTTTQIYTHLTADTLREVWATSHPRAR